MTKKQNYNIAVNMDDPAELCKLIQKVTGINIKGKSDEFCMYDEQAVLYGVLLTKEQATVIRHMFKGTCVGIAESEEDWDE